MKIKPTKLPESPPEPSTPPAPPQEPAIPCSALEALVRAHAKYPDEALMMLVLNLAGGTATIVDIIRQYKLNVHHADSALSRLRSRAKIRYDGSRATIIK